MSSQEDNTNNNNNLHNPLLRNPMENDSYNSNNSKNVSIDLVAANPNGNNLNEFNQDQPAYLDETNEIHNSLSQAPIDSKSKQLFGTDYEYEQEGVPWWMPVNPKFVNVNENEPGLINNNISAPIEEFKFESKEKEKQEKQEKQEQEREKDLTSLLVSPKVQKVVLLDFHVGIRKFILYTSVLLFLVILTNIFSGVTGFYEVKGYVSNGFVIGLLLYGLIVGYICSDPIISFEKQKYHRIVYNLQFYWICGWLCAISLFGVAIYYIIEFPHKYYNYCKEHGCDTNESIIITTCISLGFTTILYLILIAFYMDRIAKLIILSGHLGMFAHHDDWMCGCCFTLHKHCYRYRRLLKLFRRCLTHATGCRSNDIFFCQCWFRECRRKQASEWKPIALSRNENNLNYVQKIEKQRLLNENKKYQKEYEINQIRRQISEKDKLMDKAYKESLEQEKQRRSEAKEIKRKSIEEYEKEKLLSEQKQINNYYNYQSYDIMVGPGPYFGPGPGPYGPPPRGGPCCGCCDGISGGPPIDCHLCVADCGICARECCNGACGAFRCCCQPYGVLHVHHGGSGLGECCHICCHACFGACGNCKCDCSGGGGGGDCGDGAAYILGLILVIILFLLPLIIFGLMAAPFWLMAQALVRRLKDSTPYFFVILIFCLCLVPPFVIWYFMFELICSSSSSTLLDVFCEIWTLFHVMFNSV